MKHETTACFVKQARDFSVMTVEKVKVCDGFVHHHFVIGKNGRI